MTASTFREHEQPGSGSGGEPAPEGKTRESPGVASTGPGPVVAILVGAESAALPAPPLTQQVARALAGQTDAAPMATPAVAQLIQPAAQTRELIIELNPAGLGRIVATLTRVSGQLRVRLRPDSEPVAQQLQSDIGLLGKALAAAGVAVSDVSVDPAIAASTAGMPFSSPDAALGAGSHGQETSQQRRDGESTRGRPEAAAGIASSTPGQTSSGFYVV